MIELLSGDEISDDFILKYKVEIGYSIFRITTEDDEKFHIVAGEVELVERVVKYYKE